MYKSFHVYRFRALGSPGSNNSHMHSCMLEHMKSSVSK